jgi:hypothetical protein
MVSVPCTALGAAAGASSAALAATAGGKCSVKVVPCSGALSAQM